MYKIVFYGCKEDIRKISFIKLLHNEANLSLRDAKDIKDRLVDNNEVIELEVQSQQKALLIIKRAKGMSVKCKLV